MNELNDELESLQTRMCQLTTAIEEANAENEERGTQQIETLEKLKTDLEKQTALADVAEESLAEVTLQ